MTTPTPSPALLEGTGSFGAEYLINLLVTKNEAGSAVEVDKADPIRLPSFSAFTVDATVEPVTKRGDATVKDIISRYGDRTGEGTVGRSAPHLFAKITGTTAVDLTEWGSEEGGMTQWSISDDQVLSTPDLAVIVVNAAGGAKSACTARCYTVAQVTSPPAGDMSDDEWTDWTISYGFRKPEGTTPWYREITFEKRPTMAQIIDAFFPTAGA